MTKPDGLIGWAGEQQEIAVGVSDDEVPRAPGLRLQLHEEVDAGRLELAKQLSEIGGRIHRHRGRQQLFAFADVADEDGFADEPQGEPGAIALHQTVKRRLATGEFELEAEVGDEVIARAENLKRRVRPRWR